MLPNYLKDEFDRLTPFQKEQFQILVMWSNAGPPGMSFVTDSSYGNILETVKRMEEPPTEPKVEVKE